MVPKGGCLLSPVQMRRLVEIPCQNHVDALVDVSSAESDEIPDGVVPPGSPVHFQNPFHRGLGSRYLLPGVPVVPPRIVAGIVLIVQMGGI